MAEPSKNSRIGQLVGVASLVLVLLATPRAASPVADVQFQVNTFTANTQRNPGIAMDPAGNFVVAWTSFGQDGDDAGVFAQCFDANATRRGPEFQVNTYTAGQQFDPVVAMDGSGNFVVAWTSTHLMVGAAVFAQRFGATGTPRGTEFQVNAEGDAQRPSVGSDAAGNFVVAWDTGRDVRAQAFSASGTPSRSEFPVNFGRRPAVGMGPNGDFVITGFDNDEAILVFAQSYDSTGTPQGSALQVNDPGSASFSANSGVAMDATGNFVEKLAEPG